MKILKLQSYNPGTIGDNIQSVCDVLATHENNSTPAPSTLDQLYIVNIFSDLVII